MTGATVGLFAGAGPARPSVCKDLERVASLLPVSARRNSGHGAGHACRLATYARTRRSWSLGISLPSSNTQRSLLSDHLNRFLTPAAEYTLCAICSPTLSTVGVLAAHVRYTNACVEWWRTPSSGTYLSNTNHYARRLSRHEWGPGTAHGVDLGTSVRRTGVFSANKQLSRSSDVTCLAPRRRCS